VPEGVQLRPVHPAVERHHFALGRHSAGSDAGVRRIVELLRHNAVRALDQAAPAVSAEVG